MTCEKDAVHTDSSIIRSHVVVDWTVRTAFLVESIYEEEENDARLVIQRVRFAETGRPGANISIYRLSLVSQSCSRGSTLHSRYAFDVRYCPKI